MSIIIISVAMILLGITNILQASTIRKSGEKINELESELAKLKIRTDCIKSETLMKIDELAIKQIKGE